ncbi:unnamed protein product [Symbiodinium sp. CCMP2592]|nr:unnamed protein product [Symbiodinium sp. CCMP2592]
MSFKIRFSAFFMTRPKGLEAFRPVCVANLNPVWVSHGGEKKKMAQKETAELEPGDRILLYTGASDGTPDGPGSRGTVAWIVGRDA